MVGGRRRPPTSAGADGGGAGADAHPARAGAPGGPQRAPATPFRSALVVAISAAGHPSSSATTARRSRPSPVRLWLRPQPPDAEIRRGLDATLAFVEHRLGLPWVVSRQQAVLRWAASPSVLRAVAKQLGMAASEDWYVGASDTPDLDWYGEIVATLEAENRR